jgi:hypothetical protein
MSEDRVNIKNEPTPEGRALGEQLARLTEVELAKLKPKFPNHAEPCGTCAFRRGTYPNGCLATVMDALKCVVENHDFMCHEHRKGEPMTPCTGWFIAVSAMHHKAIPSAVVRAAANWEYTTEPK